MLFLFIDHVIDIELPEVRLQKCWRKLGCGDPRQMRARDAVEFARAVFDQSQTDAIAIDSETAKDIAALIISKTGANAVQFVPRISGPSEPRLSTISNEALEAFRVHGGSRMAENRESAWNWSAA
ncbi:MAG: hypothetical protein AAF216_02665 [Pseudomonadota bacterium]